MTRQTVLIVDCSPPRGEVLARLVRRQHVFCRVCAPDAAAGHVKRDPPAGLILAGEETAVPGELAAALRGFGLPVLAVGCAGPADGIRFAREPVPDAVHDFLFGTLRVRADWSMRDYAEETVRAVREQVGGGRVLLALSGGVDSSVCAALLDRAVGERLTCILVDHGLMRKNEADGVEAAFSGRGMRLIRVNARERFLGRLAGVADPERKRKIVGEEFIRVFEEEARKTGSADFLAQGTIYPDVMESGVGKGMVKSHHNVGGLPERIGFRAIIEPLRPLFKDEVRELGRLLGLSEALVERQPFPGPGLAIRCMGEVTESKLSVLREADAIFREELSEAGLAGDLSQFFAVLTDVRSVGVRGGRRTYDYTVALRAVRTDDFMTADWARIPFDLLDRVGRRITSETPSVNRVVYDITPKPPATIEWE